MENEIIKGSLKLFTIEQFFILLTLAIIHYSSITELSDLDYNCQLLLSNFYHGRFTKIFKTWQLYLFSPFTLNRFRQFLFRMLMYMYSSASSALQENLIRKKCLSKKISKKSMLSWELTYASPTKYLVLDHPSYNLKQSALLQQQQPALLIRFLFANNPFSNIPQNLNLDLAVLVEVY